MPRCPLLLAVVTLLVGCADERAASEPVLQAINGSVSNVSGLVTDGELRVAVVWFGQHETGAVG